MKSSSKKSLTALEILLDHAWAMEFNFSIFHLGLNYLEKVKDFEKVALLECWVALLTGQEFNGQSMASLLCEAKPQRPNNNFANMCPQNPQLCMKSLCGHH